MNGEDESARIQAEIGTSLSLEAQQALLDKVAAAPKDNSDMPFGLPEKIPEPEVVNEQEEPPNVMYG